MKDSEFKQLVLALVKRDPERGLEVYGELLRQNFIDEEVALAKDFLTRNKEYSKVKKILVSDYDCTFDIWSMYSSKGTNLPKKCTKPLNKLSNSTSNHMTNISESTSITLHWENYNDIDCLFIYSGSTIINYSSIDKWVEGLIKELGLDAREDLYKDVRDFAFALGYEEGTK